MGGVSLWECGTILPGKNHLVDKSEVLLIGVRAWPGLAA